MRRKRPTLLAALALCLSVGAVDAGGDSRAVRIASFARVSPDEATFVLQGVGTPAARHCARATIHAQYLPWRRWPWEAELVTRKQHREALDELARAYTAATDTQFGILGTGLGEDPGNAECRFISRALAILEEGNGRRVVYSYFKHP